MADIIQDHYQHPRNLRGVAEPTRARRGSNPMCGDELDLSIKIDDRSEAIDDIGCVSRGCSVLRASASIMTELVMHHTLSEALEYLPALRGGTPASGSPSHPAATVTPEAQQQVQALRGIQMLYPARLKCALLPWLTLRELIEEYRG